MALNRDIERTFRNFFSGKHNFDFMEAFDFGSVCDGVSFASVVVEFNFNLSEKSQINVEDDYNGSHNFKALSK